MQLARSKFPDKSSEPDFKALFERGPGLYMVLDPDLRIVAATDAYLQATMTRRSNMIGRYVFDVFPDNPEDPNTDAVQNSSASFQRVLKSGVTDAMVVQRHDIRRPESEGGGFEVRYWSPINSPVLKPDGSVAYIIHRVEDVTEFIRLKEEGVQLTEGIDTARDRTARMEADLYARSREAAETSRKLKHANQELNRIYEKTQELQRERADELTTLLEIIPIPVIMVHDPDGLNMTGNREANQLLQISSGAEVSLSAPYELKPRHFRAFKDGRELRLDELPAQRAARGVEVRDFEFSLVFDDGTTRHLLGYGTPLRDNKGKPRGAVHVLVDITERKKIEAELAESIARYELVIEGVRDAVWDWDIVNKRVFFSERWKTLRGFGDSEVSDREEEWSDRIHPDDKARVMAGLQDHFDGKTDFFNAEYRVRCKDGSWKWILDRGTAKRDATGRVIRMAGSETDITERKEMEEELRRSRDLLEQRVKERTAELSIINDELRKSEERFRALVTTSSNVIYTMSPDWSEMRQLHGRDFIPDAESPSTAWYERYIPPDDQPEVRAAISEAVRSKSTFELEHRVLRVDGTIGWTFSRAIPILDENGEIVEWFGTAIDITESKDMQEQLRQSQKMEAIGTLAGGIAHDFNNILAAIIGFTEMAIDDTADRPPVENNLKNILRSAMRARDLVKQILAFSRKTNYERAPLSFSPLVKETVQLLRASIPANIDIKLSIAATSDTVLAAPTELQQIIMNLATNASLAMEEKGGILEISLTDIDFMPDSPVAETDVVPGEYVQLMVRDTGTGMSPDVMKRIFEPFFTTRAVSKGTGMGLAVVYGIVSDLEGTITVESEPGIGSTFRVFLPKVKTGVKEGQTPTHKIPAGTESILFVDDEDMLVEWAKATLGRLGYRATVLTDPAEALKAFSSDPSRFDLVITDQSMPSMSGMHLAKELLTIRPDIPIILCTGHSTTVSPETAKEAGIEQFLMKPLTRQELARAVRHVLDEHRKK